MERKKTAAELACRIWEILQKHCGAGTYWGPNFVQIAQRYLEEGRMLEYRFQGDLGFGGKVWINNGEHPYVTCYPEDVYPERQKKIDAANAELQAESKVPEETKVVACAACGVEWCTSDFHLVKPFCAHCSGCLKCCLCQKS